MRFKAAIYAETVMKAAIPFWTLEAARDAFGRPGWRSLWDGKGIPGRADLVAECRFILLPFETELARIDSILEAEIYEAGASDEERRRVLEHVDLVLVDLRGNGGMISQHTDDELAAEATAMAQVNERFRARDRAMAAAQGRGTASWGRLPISDELARQIGLQVPAPIQSEEEIHEAR